MRRRGGRRRLGRAARGPRPPQPVRRRARQPPQWYRYHHLFAELLRARLETEEPGTAPALHGRAAAWLADEGQIAEAIGHAIAAGDRRATAELVAEHWLTFFNQGWLMTVGRWLEALPRDLLAADPRLWLARAWTFMDLGELDEAGAWLGRRPRRTNGSASCARCGSSSSATSAAPPDAVGAAVAGERPADRSGGRSPPSSPARSPTGAGAMPTRARRWRRRSGSRPRAATRWRASTSWAIWRSTPWSTTAPRAAAELLPAPPAEPRVGEHFTAMIGHLARARAAELEGRLSEAEREAARASELSRRGAGILEQAAAAVAHARVLAALGQRDAARARSRARRGAAVRVRRRGHLARALAQAGHAPGLGAPREPRGAGEPLSDSELAVLRMLHSELSLREIGSELFLSLNTIKTHTRHIYAKLGARGRDQAVARGRELGLL